jgi:hypothetical protein
MDDDLRALLEFAVGEPPRWLTFDSIRRRAIRRRITQASATGLAAVLAIGLGATLSAYAARSTPPATSGAPAGPPKYYVAQNFGPTFGSGFSIVVRARVGGRITALVRDPRPGFSCGDQLAAGGTNTFFEICGIWSKATTGTASRSGRRSARNNAKFKETQIYQFQVTKTGHATTPVLVKGGTLKGLFAGSFAASPDGRQVAVEVLRPNPDGQLYTNTIPIGILVINTKTGKRAMWRTGPYVPGARGYDGATDMSFTGNGDKLVLLEKLCDRTRYLRDCQPVDPTEVRAFGPADRGGSLQGGQLLLRLSAFRQRGTVLADALVTPDGTALNAVVFTCPKRGVCTVRVEQVAFTTGKRLREFYRVRTGTRFEGVFLRSFSSDPTGRFFILDAGAGGKQRINGWIDHGRIVPLAPADGNAAGTEVW